MRAPAMWNTTASPGWVWSRMKSVDAPQSPGNLYAGLTRTKALAAQQVESQSMRREQQECIKVRVDRQDADDDIAEPIAANRLAQKGDQEAGRERRQQQKKRVAAGL